MTLLDSNYDIALYVHIPFCRSKCIYCDFFSFVPPSVNEGIIETTIISILEELEYNLAMLPSVTIKTLYIGGGTPSLLSGKTLESLLRGIDLSLRRHNTEVSGLSEYTIEANPESVTRDFLEICSDHGVTRISIGFQSMSDRLLDILKRPGCCRDNFKSLELLESSWTGKKSGDLLSGIPTQKTDELIESISVLIENDFKHISLYTLTVEDDTELCQMVKNGSIEMPKAEEEEKMWFSGKNFLENNGLMNYEISNFAIPGYESLHNLAYWKMEPYLGIGPSAVSTMPASGDTDKRVDSSNIILRMTHSNDLVKYCRGRENNWGITTESIQAREFLLENLMMGLRLRDGIEKSLFRKRFGIDLFDILPMTDEFSDDPYYYRLEGDSRFMLEKILLSIQRYTEPLSSEQIHIQWPRDTDRGK